MAAAYEKVEQLHGNENKEIKLVKKEEENDEDEEELIEESNLENAQ